MSLQTAQCPDEDWTEQVVHYFGTLVRLRLLTSQDCLDMVTTDPALARHGLTQQLHKAVKQALQSPEVRELDGINNVVLWFRGSDASLQYAWDAFCDTCAVSKQPLSQVLHLTRPAN